MKTVTGQVAAAASSAPADTITWATTYHGVNAGNMSISGDGTTDIATSYFWGGYKWSDVLDKPVSFGHGGWGGSGVSNYDNGGGAAPAINGNPGSAGMPGIVIIEY
jgi:hypothetical protein